MSTYRQELKQLLDHCKWKEYRRFDNWLYAKYDSYKPECTIEEFVWGFCKTPEFAESFVEDVYKRVPDYKDFLLKLRNANRDFDFSKLYESWDEAAKDVIEQFENKIPYVYCIETVHTFDTTNADESKYSIMANDMDGELFNGLILTGALLDITDSISVELMGVDKKNKDWSCMFTFELEEVVDKCEILDSEYPEWFIFRPFRHPIVLFNSGVQLNITFNFAKEYTDIHHEELQNEAKVLYGVCSTPFREWLEKRKVKITLHKPSVKLILSMAQQYSKLCK